MHVKEETEKTDGYIMFPRRAKCIRLVGAWCARGDCRKSWVQSATGKQCMICCELSKCASAPTSKSHRRERSRVKIISELGKIMRLNQKKLLKRQ